MINYRVHELFGTDDRDGLLAERHPRNQPMIPKGEWLIAGLYELPFTDFKPLKGNACSLATIRATVEINLAEPIRLLDLLKFCAGVHRGMFPNGNHRYFEFVKVDQPSHTITLSMGS